MAELKTTTLELGAAAPFSLLHISDTHLALVDGRDNPRKQALAASRCSVNPTAEADLAQAEAYAKAQDMPIVCTGDVMDFVSWGNLERMARFTRENDVFYAAGNHDFSQYVGEAWEDAAYRNQSFEKVQAVHTNYIRFASRKINGVNLIAMDNSYYLIEKDHLEALKREASLGMPILLFVHCPFFEETLFQYRQSLQNPEGCAYLMGVPEPLMKDYTPHRYRQQLADEITFEAMDYILHEPMIRAVFSGHLHEDFHSELRPDLPQYVTGKNTMRRIDIL